MSNTSIGKTHEKKFGRSNLGQPKSGPKLGFLSISSVWFISLPLNCRGSELGLLVKVKPAKIFLGHKFGPNRPKSGLKLGVFLPFSQVCFVNFPRNCIG